jgi:hypothetical protein
MVPITANTVRTGRRSKEAFVSAKTAKHSLVCQKTMLKLIQASE